MKSINMIDMITQAKNAQKEIERAMKDYRRREMPRIKETLYEMELEIKSLNHKMELFMDTRTGQTNSRNISKEDEKKHFIDAVMARVLTDRQVTRQPIDNITRAYIDELQDRIKELKKERAIQLQELKQLRTAIKIIRRYVEPETVEGLEKK